MNDQKKQFTMEFTRVFTWPDQAAPSNDPAKLWSPRTMFSFPNSVKIEQVSQPYLENDGQSMMLTEHLRVTFVNGWNYEKFPLDERDIVAQMWSGSGTEVLEPVTVQMDPISLPKDLFGFRPKSKLAATVTPWGEALGPQGAWGKSQMVELKVTATRIPTSYIIKIVLPVTLCAIVAYTGFFLKIGQLTPRLAL